MTPGTTPRPLRRSAPEPLSNSCGDCQARVDAAKIIAESNEAIAEAIKAATETFAPLAHAATDGMERLDLLCKWLKTRGLLLLAGFPWILWIMGVITPEAAKTFSEVLKHLGGG